MTEVLTTRATAETACDAMASGEAFAKNTVVARANALIGGLIICLAWPRDGRAR